MPDVPDSTVAPAPSVVQSRHCWVCASALNTLWKRGSLRRPLEAGDLQITDSRYGQTLALRRCSDCGFLFADDPQLEELPELYAALDDVAYETSQHTRRRQMRWLLQETLRRFPRVDSWLDVGAGTGLLVAEAGKHGLRAMGVEPSAALVKAARELNGVDLLPGLFPQNRTAGQRFDVISLVDVIEHVTDPVQLLRECGKALTTGGCLLVVTPDAASLPARVLGRRWWHFRLAHVGYFSRVTLETAARRAGLRLHSRTRARWFFEVRYLAARLGEYLPFGFCARWARDLPGAAWMARRVVRVNLHDSWAVWFAR